MNFKLFFLLWATQTGISPPIEHWEAAGEKMPDGHMETKRQQNKSDK